jgi:hypothetical protein
LSTQNMVIMMVGDKTKLHDRLTKLGYEIVEMKEDGNPVHPPKAEVREDFGIKPIPTPPPPPPPTKKKEKKKRKMRD